LFIKVPLSVWLAFGGFGLEPRGAVGCAWATLIVNYAMLGLAIWMLRSQDLYRPYRLWHSLERPDWPQIKAFARLGVPGGLAIMVEVTSFTLMALFIARLGTVASASHQIATSLAAVSYMVPLSLAIATSSRASYWLGAGAPNNARAAIVTGLALTAGAALSLSSALWGFRHSLAHAYAISPAVTSLAATLLAWVALFHLFDAVQAVCVFILRCYRVTVAPLLVYCVLLWGVGLGGGYVLAYEGLGTLRPAPSPVTFWIAATAALAVTALIFLLFLWRAMRLPAPSHHPS
jgi:MATE family multidrug resistance protein